MPFHRLVVVAGSRCSWFHCREWSSLERCTSSSRESWELWNLCTLASLAVGNDKIAVTIAGFVRISLAAFSHAAPSTLSVSGARSASVVLKR